MPIFNIKLTKLGESLSIDIFAYEAVVPTKKVKAASVK